MKTMRGSIHGNQLLRWSGSSLLGLTLIANSTAFAGESVDRLARLLGVGWSDGYHACAADCYLPGENLPPRSYAADHSLYARAHGVASQPAHSVYRQHSFHQPAHSYETTEGMINAGPQLAAPLTHTPVPRTLSPANPEPMHDLPTQEYSVQPPQAPAATKPAPRRPQVYDEDSLLDSPSDVRAPAAGSPSASPRTTPRAAPAPVQPPMPPAKPSRPSIEQIQPPEADDLLESDDDLLLEELPAPADDSLLPYQYQREYRRLRPVGPVARTSAELPHTQPAYSASNASAERRPARIGAGTPKYLPAVKNVGSR